jgi:maltose O-acetyltransferase
MIHILKKAWNYYSFKRTFNGKIGENTNLEKGIFSNSENILIGANCHIGFDAIWNGFGRIEIGDNVIIGPKSTIWTVNHNFRSDKFLPYDEFEIAKSVIVKQNVWLGINVSLAPGVTIGEGAIIAMGSVVVKDVPALSIMGGNPAKVIGMRDSDVYSKITEKPIQDYSYLFQKNKLNLQKIKI